MIYCPTDEWHRAVEAINIKVNLIGYQFLPNREADGWPNYNDQGLGGWIVGRTKMGGPYRKAPVMIDKIQATTATVNAIQIIATAMTTNMIVITIDDIICQN